MVEDRLVGIKSREVYEAPAAVTLITAKKALEALTLTRDVAHYKTQLEDKFAELAYDGLWYSPLRLAISAFLANVNQHVTGEVTVKLYKGNATVVGRHSTKMSPCRGSKTCRSPITTQFSIRPAAI